jgi:hypothetical protein
VDLLIEQAKQKKNVITLVRVFLRAFLLTPLKTQCFQFANNLSDNNLAIKTCVQILLLYYLRVVRWAIFPVQD